MSVFYEQNFTVDSREVDLTGCARPSALLGYLQEAATRAALELHVSTPETLEKYHCFWMIVRIWLHMDEPLHWNDTFTVRTWHRGGRAVSTYRDFDLIRDGKSIGEAVSTWVLADWDTYKLFRIGKLEEFQDTDGGDRCKSKTLHRVKMPQHILDREERRMRYSDTDINGHVNNSRYADFACDALHLEEYLPGQFVNEFQIGYLNQCRAGELVTIETALQDNSYYAKGSGADGKDRFECCLGLRNL